MYLLEDHFLQKLTENTIVLLKLESYYALIDDVVHIQRIHDHILGRESEVNSGLTSIFNMSFQPCLHYGEEIQKYEGYRDQL